jgi:hypothetical protein
MVSVIEIFIRTYKTHTNIHIYMKSLEKNVFWLQGWILYE